MTKQAIIVGCENFAVMLEEYLREAGITVAAFTVDPQYIREETLLGKPVVSLSDVETRFPPEQYDCYLAIGYTKMGAIRRRIAENMAAKGYALPNFIHETAYVAKSAVISGTCNIILERAIIGSMAQIGEGNIIWPGANIGHNACVGDWNTISLNASLCGFSEIKNHCFIGANSCVRDKVVLADETLVGATAFVAADTAPKSVCVCARSAILSKKSDEIVI